MNVMVSDPAFMWMA